MEYFEHLMKGCGIAIIAVVCITVVGKLSDSAALTLRIGGGVALFAVAVLLLGENISAIESTISAVTRFDGTVGEAFSLMLKALGVALVSKLCSDICRDCGESTMANGVEAVGRIAIIGMCIPVIADILSFASDVLERGV